MFEDKTYTGKEIYQILTDFLKPAWEEEAYALSKYLLTEVLEHQWLELISSPSIEIGKETAARIEKISERLINMEPIQYILGYTYFLDRKFKVSTDVLIPRPETEELVFTIINKCKIHYPKILDIGTGSGCIGISLALELGTQTFTGIDVDHSVIKVAESNAREYGVRMNSIRLDVLKNTPPLSGYEIVVSNPPYVKPSEKIFMRKNVLDHEPSQALFVPENDPLIFYRKIISQSLNILNPGGMLFFEINELYGDEIKQLLVDLNYKDVKVDKDIHGKDRFVYGKK
jgi:release factor glutamine methyltransferase